jgi:hypothetical protein
MKADPGGHVVEHVGLQLLAGIVGSNPARGMDVCCLLVLCVVRSGM